MNTKLSPAIACLHCGNISKMEIIGTGNDVTLDDDVNGPGYEYGTRYDIIKCPAPQCKNINIAAQSWHDAFDDEEWQYKIVCPQLPNHPEGLPDKISKALNAANKVKSVDANAYAILGRRLLEMVCLDRNAKGSNLAVMLKDLSDKREIPEKLVDVAKGLKDFGNIGAHAGTGELTSKEIPIVSALCRAILEYVYSAPYLASLAEEKLKKIKVKA